MKINTIIKIIAPIALAISLNACSSGARMNAMVVPVTADNVITEDSNLYQSIELAGVSGGKKTNPLWSSQVGNEEFQQALLNSLKAHALISVDDTKYKLTATLVKLQQPFAGFSMTVKSTIKYELTDVAAQKVIYDESVYVEYTAAFGDALVGSKRLQLANEGSVKDNITKFITNLVSLSNSGHLGEAPK